MEELSKAPSSNPLKDFLVIPDHERFRREVVALGIADQKTVDSWTSDDRSKVIKLSDLQLAQINFAQAINAMSGGGSGANLQNLNNALVLLEASGGKLSDLMPWKKPPPSNAEMVKLIKETFPPTHVVPPENASPLNTTIDGEYVLNLHKKLMERSGVLQPEATAPVPRAVQSEISKGYLQGPEGTAFTAVTPGSGSLNFSFDSNSSLAGGLFNTVAGGTDFTLVNAKQEPVSVVLAVSTPRVQATNNLAV